MLTIKERRGRAGAVAAAVTTVLAAALALAGPAAGARASHEGRAADRVTVPLRPVAGETVKGTATLAAAGAATRVSLAVTGVAPGAPGADVPARRHDAPSHQRELRAAADAQGRRDG